MDDDRRSGVVAACVVGGLTVFVVSGLVAMALYGAGALAFLAKREASLIVVAAVPVTVGLLGLGAVVVGLVIGTRRAWGTSRGSKVERLDDALIVAAFTLDRKHNSVFDPSLLDPAEVCYYARIQMKNGKAMECLTSPEVYATLGEGMRGTVRIQGHWLGSFVRSAPE